MRRKFAVDLYELMKRDKNIILITADMGFGMLDKIRDELPDQFYNPGAAEQVAVTMAVGLALSGKIPVVYTITPFLLYRPYEVIKLYLEGEGISVKLVGSGMNDDYKTEGLSHHAFNVDNLLNLTPSIVQIYPKKIDNISYIIKEMIYNNKPCFLGLNR